MVVIAGTGITIVATGGPAGPEKISSSESSSSKSSSKSSDKKNSSSSKKDESSSENPSEQQSQSATQQPSVSSQAPSTTQPQQPSSSQPVVQPSQPSQPATPAQMTKAQADQLVAEVKAYAISKGFKIADELNPNNSGWDYPPNSVEYSYQEIKEELIWQIDEIYRANGGTISHMGMNPMYVSIDGGYEFYVCY